MGFVFRKSFKVAPGVRFNVSKRGMGVSVGARNGPRVSVNSQGRVTKSVRLAPGLRYQETSTLGKSKRKRKASQEAQTVEQTPTEQPQVYVPEVVEEKEPRNLWLPHSIWSILSFALAGFISATQNSYDKVAFLLVALGVVFLLTYLWNLLTKGDD